MVEEHDAEVAEAGAPIMRGEGSINDWITRKHRHVAREYVNQCVLEAILQQGADGTELVFDEGMSGADFERFCAEELTRGGWAVRLIGKSGDQGGDLVAG